MHLRYSLHKIDNTTDFGFDPADYSRFKFGDGSIAEQFGLALAEGFIDEVFSGIEIEQQLVVMSSPYDFIPTATNAMKDYFVFRLNRYLIEQGKSVVQEAKIHRTTTYKEDYGALNAEERMRLIGNDTFHVDKSFLEGKTLIFMDDIRITGSHERMIKKMISEYGIQNDAFLLYFAELINDEIHPNVENYLNFHAVKSVFDLGELIQNKRFTINTRIVKYILNSEQEIFQTFIEQQNQSFKNLLLDMAIGNGYHTMDSYRANIHQLKNSLNTNQITQLNYGN